MKKYHYTIVIIILTILFSCTNNSKDYSIFEKRINKVIIVKISEKDTLIIKDISLVDKIVDELKNCYSLPLDKGFNEINSHIVYSIRFENTNKEIFKIFVNELENQGISFNYFTYNNVTKYNKYYGASYLNDNSFINTIDSIRTYKQNLQNNINN